MQLITVTVVKCITLLAIPVLTGPNWSRRADPPGVACSYRPGMRPMSTRPTSLRPAFLALLLPLAAGTAAAATAADDPPAPPPNAEAVAAQASDLVSLSRTRADTTGEESQAD